MGLLFRIIKRLFLFVTELIKDSLKDSPYQNQVLVGIANLLIILSWLGGFGIAIYLLVWAFSLEILLLSLLIAYLAAYAWSKCCNYFTPFVQEVYLIGSSVGLTVLIGALIQIRRMPEADGKALLFYWIFLLIVGFILWGITLFNVTYAAKVKPVLAIKKIEYKQRFRITKLPNEIPTNNPAQAYLKKLK